MGENRHRHSSPKTYSLKTSTVIRHQKHILGKLENRHRHSSPKSYSLKTSTVIRHPERVNRILEENWWVKIVTVNRHQKVQLKNVNHHSSPDKENIY